VLRGIGAGVFPFLVRDGALVSGRSTGVVFRLTGREAKNRSPIPRMSCWPVLPLMPLKPLTTNSAADGALVPGAHWRHPAPAGRRARELLAERLVPVLAEVAVDAVVHIQFGKSLIEVDAGAGADGYLHDPGAVRGEGSKR
jgi:hypothetical protein